jgi:hypothetical protein
MQYSSFMRFLFCLLLNIRIMPILIFLVTDDRRTNEIPGGEIHATGIIY